MFPRIPNGGGLFPRRPVVGGLTSLPASEKAQQATIQQPPAAFQQLPAVPQQMLPYQPLPAPQQLPPAQPYPQQLVPAPQANYPQPFPMNPPQNTLDPQYLQAQQQQQQQQQLQPYHQPPPLPFPLPQNPQFQNPPPLQPGFITTSDLHLALEHHNLYRSNAHYLGQEALNAYIRQHRVTFMSETGQCYVADQEVLGIVWEWVKVGMPGRGESGRGRGRGGGNGNGCIECERDGCRECEREYEKDRQRERSRERRWGGGETALYSA